MFATPNILLQRITVAEEKSGLMKANESIQRSGPWAWWVHPKKEEKKICPPFPPMVYF
jgi:hypothetical protein